VSRPNDDPTSQRRNPQARNSSQLHEPSIGMSLTEYKRKRSFGATPEPAAGGRRSAQRIFVVQLHHASHRHYDFRLELGGTLKSWAVPKGPSFDPGVKRLAMEVEDHPISYATFEGDIPKGNYGAGHVDVFDHGTWEPIGNAQEGLAEGELKFILRGDVLRGSWVLVRTRKQGSKQPWLLIKHRDEFSGPTDANDFVDAKTDRPISVAARKKVWKSEKNVATAAARQRSMPSRRTSPKGMSAPPPGAKPEILRNEPFLPELCRAHTSPPSGNDWLHEVKWDGYRIVATVVGSKVRLWSRNAIEWTKKVPELASAIAALKLKSAQLDGEMIVLQDGRDNFNALQSRLSAENKAPLVYMLFDLPHLDGLSFRDVALIERKKRLVALLDRRPHPMLRYSEHQIGHGKEVFAQAIAAGLEGVVSKRAGSFYRAARNGDWVKAKGRASDEFIVVGYTAPKGSRSGIGALLLAQPKNGQLRYVGRVGTGFSDEQLRALQKQLKGKAIDETPADISLMERKDKALAIWVEPELVVEVFFQGVGGQGLLRQSAFKTLRDDKRSADVLEPSEMKTATTRKAARTTGKPVDAEAAVALSHSERVVFPELGISKADVADYYRVVAKWLLPEVVERPLSVVRCPDGIAAQCFFQKHVGRGWGRHVHGIDVKDKTSREKYLFIDDEQGLLELVQVNVLEFHPWGARNKTLARADRIVFDLDPHASVKWSRVTAGARQLRKHLESIGLRSYLRTSGGKGLHVVVPLNPPAPWDDVKAFAHAVASALAALDPKEFVDVAGEKNRAGKIFIDWLRNGRGSTSVASYSLRARANAGVAMPLAWEALARVKSGDEFTIENTVKRVKRRSVDPWADIASIKQSLPV
jgi:bifunctional non-homologous end joining protein LigD